ncbi:hypothetical protein [Polymorphum gilvum]|uniref:Uncharacterized protein n=1 Tax=Polymorphum gilvum (strain LMG 25793 / CGMCC 1.9160 / SL003B-26A1) TaxID=991905 RepID=F2J0K6_POLGS|nr:hypothetical protein [Polymorphum gilvum]ADZ69674.1 hypothetical protein SL003B_1245 [Polymorphum gilvum SL003B-26A1]
MATRPFGDMPTAPQLRTEERETGLRPLGYAIALGVALAIAMSLGGGLLFEGPAPASKPGAGSTTPDTAQTAAG